MKLLVFTMSYLYPVCSSIWECNKVRLKAAPNCAARLPNLAHRGAASEKIVGDTPKSVSVSKKPVKLHRMYHCINL